MTNSVEAGRKSVPPPLQYTIRTTNDPKDAKVISAVVNEAFEVEAFFKKPEHVYRLDDSGDLAIQQMRGETYGTGIFVVAESTADSPVKEMYGCLWAHWSLSQLPTGYAAMVSVRDAYQGKGIGTALIKAAEVTCADALRGSKGADETHFNMEIRFVSVRRELKTWYERHGYKESPTLEPFVVPHIVADGFDVKLVLMEKSIPYSQDAA